MNQKEIESYLFQVEQELLRQLPKDDEYVNIHAYRSLVRDGIWTLALQTALLENKAVYIPKSDTPYLLDDTVILSSNCHIKADPEAVIRLTKDTKVLMFRNEHTIDGTHEAISSQREKAPDKNAYEPDHTISIIGGRYEESRSERAGYGKTGMYDQERSFFGVSTCFFFNNMEDLIIRDVTFAHTAGFAVQTGALSRALFQSITFESCYADGLHLNGQSSDLILRDIHGQVGDDLVALNMYDWQNSSVNFGPMDRVLCENLTLSKDSPYKAMRIEPGMYFYDDGSKLDCGLYNAVIRNVRGINTFKLYYQTPPYYLGELPEKGGIGSCDHLYFENITIDLDQPIDTLNDYMESDPIRGTFAGFEFGSDIGEVTLKNIDLTLHKDQYPYSYLACTGPKSILIHDEKGVKEIFDPYLKSSVKHLILEDIRINGERIEDASPYLREISFEDVDHDGHSTGEGHFVEWTIAKSVTKENPVPLQNADPMETMDTLSPEEEAAALFSTLYATYQEGQPALLKRAIHDASLKAKTRSGSEGSSAQDSSIPALVPAFFAHVVSLQEYTVKGNLPKEFHIMEDRFYPLLDTLPKDLSLKAIRLLIHTDQMLNNTISMIQEKIMDDDGKAVGEYLKNLEKTLDENPLDVKKESNIQPLMYVGIGLILLATFLYTVLPILIYGVITTQAPAPFSTIITVISVLLVSAGFLIEGYVNYAMGKEMRQLEKAIKWDMDTIKKASDELTRMSSQLDQEYTLLDQELTQRRG